MAFLGNQPHHCIGVVRKYFAWFVSDSWAWWITATVDYFVFDVCKAGQFWQFVYLSLIDFSVKKSLEQKHDILELMEDETNQQTGMNLMELPFVCIAVGLSVELAPYDKSIIIPWCGIRMSCFCSKDFSLQKNKYVSVNMHGTCNVLLMVEIEICTHP